MKNDELSAKSSLPGYLHPRVDYIVIVGVVVVGQKQTLRAVHTFDCLNSEVCDRQSGYYVVFELIDHHISFVQLSLDETPLFVSGEIF